MTKTSIRTAHAWIMILIIFSLILTGCGTTTSNKVPKFNVGTQGLIMEFAKSNPLSVYEGEEFGTALFVRNVGSYDLMLTNPAVLKISYDDYRMELVQTLGRETEIKGIHGRSVEYPDGEEAPVESYFRSKRLTNLREGSTTYINYNLCYPYETELTTMTCIDTKMVNRDESAAACKTETYNGGAGQGAPIVITKIEPEIMLQTNYVRPQFRIHIENLGGGYVTSALRCEGGMTNINDRETSGFVRVEAWLSGVEEEHRLECGPDNEGILRLIDSDSFIRCYLPAGDDRYARDKKNYITPLTVRVTYTYVTIEEKKIEIKRNELNEAEPSQGLCDFYEVEFEGRCITKCEYCSKHPTAALCQSNKPYNGFSFKDNFACTCSLQQCIEKLGKGSCIKGYCPGDRYCCSSAQCDSYQVEYDGRCIDKCEYCQTHSNDTIICPQNLGIDFRNFRCQTMTYAQCTEYAKQGSCVTGLCGGPNKDTSYCTNITGYWLNEVVVRP